MTKLDPAELQDAICATADDQILAAYLILKVSPTSNTLIVSTCDTKQAARLLRMQLLPLRSCAPLPIKAHQVPATGMSRGHACRGCRASETSETLANALVSDGVETLMARPMGKNAPKPPREVLYWSFVKRGERQEQRPLVCLRCHKPRHKKATCPLEQTVCGSAGEHMSRHLKTVRIQMKSFAQAAGKRGTWLLSSPAP
ncbi:hypothetical protein HPB48_022411 [Haemaphysalis longicornis]|uniref:Uncharacterized protein n=1 Tax=Haemaphysalis longicornis TaxID=44386 RepID=A0A9J6H5J4_HAELO|nr:hypothetical protein HPB48_022411 [Haemaphysalis longicornis]